MRDPLSAIQRNFPPPLYSFEPGFSEEDLIWQPDVRETKEHIKRRAHAVLDSIFGEVEEACTYLSIPPSRRIYRLCGLYGMTRYLSHCSWRDNQWLLGSNGPPPLWSSYRWYVKMALRVKDVLSAVTCRCLASCDSLRHFATHCLTDTRPSNNRRGHNTTYIRGYGDYPRQVGLYAGGYPAKFPYFGSVCERMIVVCG